MCVCMCVYVCVCVCILHVVYHTNTHSLVLSRFCSTRFDLSFSAVACLRWHEPVITHIFQVSSMKVVAFILSLAAIGMIAMFHQQPTPTSLLADGDLPAGRSQR
jgi:hypothetical protein